MSKLAIIHDRQPDNSFRPVGVVLGTRNRIDFKFQPGATGWQEWGEGIAANAQPPYKDGTGANPERGTWEDWIPWAVDAFSNGHDTWLTQVDIPETTIDANYQRYVLGVTPDLTPAALKQPADAIPELGGFRKVTPT